MRVTKLGVVLAAGLSVVLAVGAMAQGPKFFRIGTGGTAGTYYPVGGIIANAISNPPNLVSTAVASNGSVANVNAIVGGQMESGFTQSDVAYWAYTGTGVFEGKPQVTELRAIANLYPESIHLVARKGAGINSVADLRGKRVSIDEPGSGTLVDAKIIMAGWGIKESDIKPEYVKPNQAAEKMKDGALDAIFFVGGFPAAAITELATSGPGIELVPIDGPNAEKIRASYKFFASDQIPAGTYKGVEAVKTLSVGAQWITSAKIDEATVYAVTKGLWSDKARQALDAGHAKGKAIQRENALSGIGIPVHPGAEKFYREVGLIK